MFLACGIFLLCSIVANAADPEYDYADKGPAKWPTLFKDYCGGASQSPVNLVNAIKKPALGEITFGGYGNLLNSPKIVNNGHTAQVSRATNDGASITKGVLGKIKYDFLEFHFHWGSDDTKGSEHTLNGTAFPMELQIVHTNEKYKKNFADALGDKDGQGIAVVAVFFKVSTENKKLAPIIQALKKITFKDNEEKLAGKLALEDLLPDKTKRSYMTYSGSLTTPNCNEGVTWIVLEEPVTIGKNQQAAFRALYSGADTSSPKMENNFRPVQNLGSRVINEFAK